MMRPRHDATEPVSMMSDARAPREPSAREEAGAVALALLPWGISILFHAALVLVAFFLIWAVMAQRAEEKLVIPELTFAPQATMMMQSTEQQRVTQSGHTRSISAASVPVPSPSDLMKVDLKLNTIGLLGGAGNPGLFNPTGTAGVGDVEFIGQKIGNAERIVFVVDASGSLLDTFPFVLRELRKSVGSLSEKQSFTIIFFQGDGAMEVAVPRSGLKPATAQTKQQVRDWLSPEAGNVRPQGGTNPLPGLQLGLRYRPEVMLLLSDNITGGGTGATAFEIDQARLLDEVRRANVGGTKITTMQFLYPDPLEKVPGMRGTLEQIAEQSGGDFIPIHAGDLNLP